MRRSRESWPLVGSLVACAVYFTIISFRRRVLIVVRAGLLSLLVSQGIGATMIAWGVRFALASNPQAAYASSEWLSLVHVITLLPVLLPPALTWTQRRERTARPNL